MTTESEHTIQFSFPLSLTEVTLINYFLDILGV